MPTTTTTAPRPERLSPTSGEWRWRCVELAWRSDRDDAAVYLGRSARGLESYTVESKRHEGLRYLVTYQQIGLEHHWRCECWQGAMRRPCSHVGAALLLAGHRAEVIEAMVAASNARLTWANVTRRGGSANGRAFYLVPVDARRTWDTVLVTWDPRPGRDVAVSCACEEIACAHIGAVALQRAHDKRQQERMRRFGGEPSWRFI